MPRKQSKPAAARAAMQRSSQSEKGSPAGPKRKEASKDRTVSEWFSIAACETARLAGKPLTFLAATLAVVIWASSGPFFGYSDTWQLVINTSTTIITFLMVFLVQHTQNRDTLALQLKLAELIIAAQGAENRLATAEDMSEEDLERLHETFRNQADETLTHLKRRRDESLKRAS
jgi:low affinity Fe/Cu permease